MTNPTPRPTLLGSPIRFTLLAVLGVTGFALGVAGLLELQGSTNTSTAWFNAVYHSLQLFVLDGDFHGDPIPWTLQLGRFLCGFTTIAVVISVVLAALTTSLRGIISRFWGGHVLIIGPGRLASAVARHARNEGQRVILAASSFTAKTWRAEVGPQFPMLAGKTGSASFLERCKASRASRILIIGNDDADNLAAAAALDKIPSSRSSQERKVLVSNSEARASLDAGSSFLKQVEVVSLNFEERRARKFFADHPLDFLPLPAATSSYSAKGATLIVVGWGSFAEKIIVQAGRIGHFASGVKTRVVLIAPKMEEEFAVFLRRWPAVESILEISRVEYGIGDPGLREFLFSEFDRAAQREEPLTVAIADGAQASGRLGAALWVQDLLPKDVSCVRIIPDLGSSAELGELVVTEAFQTDHENVRAFISPIHEETLDLELRDSVDGLAKGLHEQYIASRKRSRLVDTQDPVRPAEQPWRYLEETFRVSSRALADHLPIKLRAIGCEVVKDSEMKCANPVQLSDLEVEILAKVEHQRWCAERLLAGWVFHPKRDDQRLYHNLLVPWEKLSEADRYLDRDVVKGAAKALTSLNQSIRRISKTVV